MSTTQCCRPIEPVAGKASNRARIILILLTVCAGVSFVLYQHGAEWWYAPLAFSGFIISHMLGLMLVVYIVARVSKKKTATDDQGCCHADSEHAHAAGGIVVRKPRLYDILVRTITLGREGRLRQRMLELANLEAGDSVLDVGCGTATLLLAAAKTVGPEAKLHGIEPAPEMIAHAKRKAESAGVSLELTEGSADNLPYATATYDVVFCTLVLHHLSPAVQSDAIREMHRVLRPNGRLVIVDLQKPKSYLRAFTAIFSLISILHNLGSSTNAADVLDIEPELSKLGFKEIKRHSLGSGAIGAVVGVLVR